MYGPPATCRLSVGLGSPEVVGTVEGVDGTVVLFKSESNIASRVASVSREGSVEEDCIVMWSVDERE